MDTQIYETIKKYSDEISEQVIQWRRKIHEYPELANQEFRTAELIVKVLRDIGVDEIYEGQAGGTGVLGVIRGEQDGPIVGLRADMDALVIKENTELPFASRETAQWGGKEVPVMHACGHDAHVAMLLGSASVLVKLRKYIKGSVLLVFQPSEEGPSPGLQGSYGAKKYLEEEQFQSLMPKAMFGMHVDPKAPIGSAGQLGYVGGITCMACTMFTIRFKGVGAHGSLPWTGAEVLIPTAQTLLGLQAITTQNVNPKTNPIILTCGQMAGGVRYNVMAEESFISGACRFTDYSTKDLLEGRIIEVAEGCAKASGVKAEVQWDMHIPNNKNDFELVEHITPCFKEILGEENVKVDPPRAFGSPDDFGQFSNTIPCLYAALSVAPDDGIQEEVPGIHSDNFVLNEKALVNGVKAHTVFALGYLENN